MPMQRHCRIVRTGLLTLAVATAFAASAAANQLVPAKQTCTTLNCGALELPGQINGHPVSNLATAWVGQVVGQRQSCLRFQVTSASTNLVMSVVAPDGQVFTNDNGGVAPCTKCPVVVVGTAKAGAYTVAIAFRGATSVEATFSLRAGLYNSGNVPNCNNPTAPK